MKSVQMWHLDHRGNKIGVLDILSPKTVVIKLKVVALNAYASSIQIYFAICSLKGTVLKW